MMKKRLFRFDYQQGTTMNAHITVFNQLVAYLLNLDLKFEDEDLALMLLSSLPDAFEHLETTLLHEKENVSLDVCSDLYMNLRKQDKMKTKSTTSEEALVARGRQQIQAKGRRGRSKSKGRAVAKDECAFCMRKDTGRKTVQNYRRKGRLRKMQMLQNAKVMWNQISL